MLSIQSISKSYKKQQVLQNVSFDAAPGECIGLLGPNGCGKSTLLHILSGTDTPDSGTILFDGKNLLKNPSLQSTKIGYVAQNNPLFPDMTAMDHLKLWYSATKYSIEDDLTIFDIWRMGAAVVIGGSYLYGRKKSVSASKK